MEKDETPHETALRETKEEQISDVEFLKDLKKRLNIIYRQPQP